MTATQVVLSSFALAACWYHLWMLSKFYQAHSNQLFIDRQNVLSMQIHVVSWAGLVKRSSALYHGTQLYTYQCVMHPPRVCCVAFLVFEKIVAMACALMTKFILFCLCVVKVDCLHAWVLTVNLCFVLYAVKQKLALTYLKIFFILSFIWPG